MLSLSSKQININKGNKGGKKAAANVDDEWSSFISNHYQDDMSDDDAIIDDIDDIDIDIDDNMVTELVKSNKSKDNNNNKKLYDNDNAPTPSDIYISTKSKIAYLTEPVDLRVFWDIPIIPYATPSNGVIKKQIKINSKSQEELDEIQSRLQKELYFDEHVMSHIDNPSGRQYKLKHSIILHARYLKFACIENFNMKLFELLGNLETNNHHKTVVKCLLLLGPITHNILFGNTNRDFANILELDATAWVVNVRHYVLVKIQFFLKA